jgi:DNA-binding phage protein
MEKDRRAAAVWAWKTAKWELEKEGKEVDNKSRKLMRRACGLFKERWQGQLPRPVARFVRRWGQWEESPDNPERSISDRPGKGKKTHLTDEAAKRAAAIMMEGYVENGQREGYSSVSDALARSPELAAIAKDAKVKAPTLWRHLKKRENLRCRWAYPKQPLSPEQMQQRRAVVQKLLAMGGPELLDYLKRTFWIDSKHMRVTATRRRVIGRKGVAVRYRNHALAGREKNKDKKWINFYVVVNWFVGPVLYAEVTGTTGLARAYKVGEGK